MPNPLEETLRRVEADPRSGQSLLLYALFKTLCPDRGGHNYLLTKLKEMNPDTREVAFALMEAMARGEYPATQWSEMEQRLDRAIAN